MNARAVRRYTGNLGCVLLGAVVTGSTLLTAGTRLGAQQPAVATHVQTSASFDEMLARRVTIHLANVSLTRAIDSLSQVAKVFVQYKLPLLKAYSAPVTLDVTSKPLGIVLEQLLNGTALRVVPESPGSLTIVPLQESSADSVPSVGTVSGRVVDSATGHGVPGATVKIAGTKLSVVVQDSGRFSLKNVPVGDGLLTVRAFGYRPADRTITVADGTPLVLRIAVTAAPNVLSGVVTTATGTQRKLEVGSDITTLNADSIIRVAPVHSMTDLLETRVPGLTVLHSSGVPGDPSRLRLRGAGSVQLNNDPIIIIDGIRVYSSQSDPRNQNQAPAKEEGGVNQFNAPSPLDQIDPNNVETIEVLKGPSATAIYGSDAANGVIVVTTKHGRAGPTHWDVAISNGVNWLPGKWPTNYYRFGTTTASDAGGFICAWYDASCTVDSVVPFQALNDPRYSVFAHGHNQDGSLTVSGGTSALTYSLTGGATGTLGYLKLPASEQARYDSLYGQSYGVLPTSLIQPDRYTTWSVSGSVTAQPYRTLRVTLQSSLNDGHQQHSELEGAINQLQGEYVIPTLQTGPLLSQEYERATDDQLTSNNAIALHWEPRSWLPVDVTGGLSTVQRNDVSYVPYGIFDGLVNSGTGICGGNCGDTTGYYGIGRGSSRNQTLQVGTTMPLFARKVLLAVGGNIFSESTTDFNVFTDQLSPGVSVPTQFKHLCDKAVSSGICDSPTNQSTSGQSTYGWYVEPRLNMGSFFAAPGFRLDGGSGGSTSSGSIGGLSGFPKMNLSYVTVDRQGGRPLWGVVSLLRTRASFGYAGTQPLPQDKLRLFNVGNYYPIVPGGPLLGSGGCGFSGATVVIDGTNAVPGVCLSTLGNTLLRPERTGELEGGFDADLWQNRLSVTYTRYDKTRHDAILSIPVAPSVYSFSTTLIEKNVGVIRNTGTEMTVTAVVLESRTLGWTVGANLSNDNNLVVRLNRGQLPIILNQYLESGVQYILGGGVQSRVQAGYPLSGMFAYPIVGYADVNGNGIIDPNEIRYGDSVVYVGQPNPKYQLSVTNSITLFNGRLGIHTNMSYQSGLTQDLAGACGSGAFSLLPNKPGTTLGTQAAVVAAGCTIGGNKSDIGLLQVVNEFRLQDLSINYVVPQTVANWVRVPRMGLALQGSNLGLHTNYRGLDPNVNAFSTASAGDQTADNGQIPTPRSWQLRVTLGN